MELFTHKPNSKAWRHGVLPEAAPYTWQETLLKQESLRHPFISSTSCVTSTRAPSMKQTSQMRYEFKSVKKTIFIWNITPGKRKQRQRKNCMWQMLVMPLTVLLECIRVCDDGCRRWDLMGKNSIVPSLQKQTGKTLLLIFRLHSGSLRHLT